MHITSRISLDVDITLKNHIFLIFWSKSEFRHRDLKLGFFNQNMLFELEASFLLVTAGQYAFEIVKVYIHLFHM